MEQLLTITMKQLDLHRCSYSLKFGVNLSEQGPTPTVSRLHILLLLLTVIPPSLYYDIFLGGERKEGAVAFWSICSVL